MAMATRFECHEYQDQTRDLLRLWWSWELLDVWCCEKIVQHIFFTLAYSNIVQKCAQFVCSTSARHV